MDIFLNTALHFLENALRLYLFVFFGLFGLK